jgi:hypothetical protein
MFLNLEAHQTFILLILKLLPKQYVTVISDQLSALATVIVYGGGGGGGGGAPKKNVFLGNPWTKTYIQLSHMSFTTSVT